MRFLLRGLIIVLALVLAIASGGTVLCEMDCAAGGHASPAAAINDGMASTPTSHCDGEQMDSSHHTLSPHGSSTENPKRGGAHLHPRIVATVAAGIQILPKRTSSDFAVNSVVVGSGIFVRVEANLWNHNSSPPINLPSVFSAGVLRI
jgi:hypothetical protein